VPSSATDLYEVVLDVHCFPSWAPGVGRVEVLEGYGEPEMISEWEICCLGMRRKFLSVLEEARSPALLRWSYDGVLRGWGQCEIRNLGDSALAVFRSRLWAKEPALEKLMGMRATRDAATSHLKRCLTKLGRKVSGEGARVRVGPVETGRMAA
jgi:polyketide cyclase/dehydrase/lipid transport protein